MTSNTTKPMSRRHAIKLFGSIATLAGSANAIANSSQNVNIVDPKSAQAARLNYVEDALQTDIARNPQYEQGMMCRNCRLYAGRDYWQYGPCSSFPGASVATAGWCNSWTELPS